MNGIQTHESSAKNTHYTHVKKTRQCRVRSHGVETVHTATRHRSDDSSDAYVTVRNDTKTAVSGHCHDSALFSCEALDSLPPKTPKTTDIQTRQMAEKKAEAGTEAPAPNSHSQIHGDADTWRVETAARCKEETVRVAMVLTTLSETQAIVVNGAVEVLVRRLSKKYLNKVR